MCVKVAWGGGGGLRRRIACGILSLYAETDTHTEEDGMRGTYYTILDTARQGHVHTALAMLETSRDQLTPRQVIDLMIAIETVQGAQDKSEVPDVG